MPELIVGAVVGAGLVSQPIAALPRKGVVHGLAGVLTAYDAVRTCGEHEEDRCGCSGRSCNSVGQWAGQRATSLQWPTEGHQTPVGSTS